MIISCDTQLATAATERGDTAMTNGDILKCMTDDEIANIVEFKDCKTGQIECPYLRDKQACTEHDCIDGFLQWLKQEV